MTCDLPTPPPPVKKTLRRSCIISKTRVCAGDSGEVDDDDVASCATGGGTDATDATDATGGGGDKLSMLFELCVIFLCVCR